MNSKPNYFSRPDPQWRRLRGYAFDPGLSQQFDTASMNEIVFRVPWENLEPGPVGEYVEVVDFDPASDCFYAPVDLNDPQLVGADGEDPNESNPRFHQQFVYAVAMTTIKNFEKALGRKVFWSPQRDETKPAGRWESFVQRLRIYPHAFRGANAYYSPEKKALLFGYFPASENAQGAQLPGGLVFTCLSHDIIAHETTHALLDATWSKYMDASNPDLLAFHEAFADIVALFQHFSFPDVLRHQIAQTRGDLASQSLLGQLAQQFGQATGARGALRQAIGEVNENTGTWEQLKPNPSDYKTLMEPHDRGALLVAAIFDAFLAIYKSRILDLIRLATGGTGVLPPGELSPDLIARLTKEASKTAQHVLTMCIRALDYCPPVDLTFGDYLRAIVTADTDLVPDDEHNYRVAFIEAFRKRGMYPKELKTVSEETLRWPRGDRLDDKAKLAVAYIATHVRDLPYETQYKRTRRELFNFLRKRQETMHQEILAKAQRAILGNLAQLTGLVFDSKTAGSLDVTLSRKLPAFEVHSIRPAKRRGPKGEEVNHVILSITQRRFIHHDGETLRFQGGCTLILDLNTQELKYAITKSIADDDRERDFRKWIGQNPTAIAMTDLKEPISHLHLS